MGKNSKSQYPTQDIMSLQQALDWLACGIRPLPYKYEELECDEIIEARNSHTYQIKEAKKKIFIALLENKIPATGEDISSSIRKIIPTEDWYFKKTDWVQK